MERFLREIRYFWNSRLFAVMVPVTAVLAYITQLLHPTVGIDDTAYQLYFVDGVAPAAGRWCLFLLRYLFPMDYNPYFMEALGIGLFVLAVSVWCVVFYRVLPAQTQTLVYALAASAFVSSPILAELVVWYLQNGIYVGYAVTALAVLVTMESFLEADGKKSLIKLGEGIVLLTIAVGFYESFVLVYLIGMLLVFLMDRIYQKTGYAKRVGRWLWAVPLVLAGMVLLRTVIMAALEKAFHLEQQKLLETRGLAEGLAWFGKENAPGELLYLAKSFFVKYYIHGIVYLPVFLAVVSIAVLLVWGVRHCILMRDIWIAPALLMILLLPFGMSVLEGVASYYRSAQYIPLLTAAAVLTAGVWLGRRQKRVWNLCGALLAAVLLYRQCYEMNSWLYLESLKYEDAKKTVTQISDYLREQGLEQKPVCFAGTYEMPEILWERMSCPSWSKKYRLTKALVCGLDARIFAEYETPCGYAACETPKLNFMEWGMTAFRLYNRELSKFAKMEGVTLREDLNGAHYRELQELSSDMALWPEEGSVLDRGDYVAVRLGP